MLCMTSSSCVLATGSDNRRSLLTPDQYDTIYVNANVVKMEAEAGAQSCSGGDEQTASEPTLPSGSQQQNAGGKKQATLQQITTFLLSAPASRSVEQVSVTGMACAERHGSDGPALPAGTPNLHRTVVCSPKNGHGICTGFAPFLRTRLSRIHLHRVHGRKAQADGPCPTHTVPATAMDARTNTSKSTQRHYWLLLKTNSSVTLEFSLLDLIGCLRSPGFGHRPLPVPLPQAQRLRTGCTAALGCPGARAQSYKLPD